MKNLLLTAVAFFFVFNAYCQQDSTIIQKDTTGYKLELKKFYDFLNDNYDQYKKIEFNDNEATLSLQKECENILSIIYSKSEYVDQEMAVYNSTTYSYIYYDVGGKNCPKVYEKIITLHKLCKKITSVKNEKRWHKMNEKMIKKIDEILETNKTKNI